MAVPVFGSPLTRMPRLGFGTWPMQGAGCRAAVDLRPDAAGLAALPKGRRLVNPGFAPDWAA